MKIHPETIEIEMQPLRKSKELCEQISNSNFKWNKNHSKEVEFVSLFFKLPMPLRAVILNEIHPDNTIAATRFKFISKRFCLFADELGENDWLGKINKKFKLTFEEIKQIKNNESYASLYHRLGEINYLCNTIREFSWDIKQLEGGDAYYAEASQTLKALREGIELGEKELQKKLDFLINMKANLAERQNQTYNTVHLWNPF